ncbi:MAG: nitroreductase, partial [Gammaproteobacteria bacterium]|nr:nitroreductase [Gammaproteobacteria bacterium]
MQKLSFLNEQISTPAKDLSLPAPDADQLEAILQTAMSAPDHGGLVPFRFLIIQGDARLNLSEVFEKAAINRNADEAAVSKQKKKLLRSPMIIIVIAHLTNNPVIPEIEQMLSAGAAAQHIQIACKSLGFGSIWLTGENCYDLHVYESLGLAFNERV